MGGADRSDGCSTIQKQIYGGFSRCGCGGYRVCVRTRRETAGPSTTLRSGRDDNSVGILTASSPTASKAIFCKRIVIPTGAKRSGGTCGFSPSSHADSIALIFLATVPDAGLHRGFFSLFAQSFSRMKAPAGELISLFSHKVHSFSESFAEPETQRGDSRIFENDR